jgi:nicotinamidase/pyrazinamidase
MRLDAEESALIVIDVQNDFCPGGALAVPSGDAVVAPINRISSRFRHQVFTQDWHPAGHVSFASSWKGRAVHDLVKTENGEQVLWPDHCVQGSRGADFHPGLVTLGASVILRKGTRRSLDSYSALFENDRATPTGLEGWLSSLRIKTLYLAGLATDYCVYYTALDALRLGFGVVLVEDGLEGVGLPTGSVERALADLRARGASFIASSKLED